MIIAYAIDGVAAAAAIVAAVFCTKTVRSGRRLARRR